MAGVSGNKPPIKNKGIGLYVCSIKCFSLSLWGYSFYYSLVVFWGTESLWLSITRDDVNKLGVNFICIHYGECANRQIEPNGTVLFGTTTYSRSGTKMSTLWSIWSTNYYMYTINYLHVVTIWSK